MTIRTTAALILLIAFLTGCETSSRHSSGVSGADYYLKDRLLHGVNRTGRYVTFSVYSNNVHANGGLRLEELVRQGAPIAETRVQPLGDAPLEALDPNGFSLPATDLSNLVWTKVGQWTIRGRRIVPL